MSIESTKVWYVFPDGCIKPCRTRWVPVPNYATDEERIQLLYLDGSEWGTGAVGRTFVDKAEAVAAGTALLTPQLSMLKSGAQHMTFLPIAYSRVHRAIASYFTP